MTGFGLSVKPFQSKNDAKPNLTTRLQLEVQKDIAKHPTKENVKKTTTNK